MITVHVEPAQCRPVRSRWVVRPVRRGPGVTWLLWPSHSALPPVAGIPDAVAMSWSDLPPAARSFRIAHVVWAVVSMASLGRVWWSACTGRRDRALAASIAWLAIEGVALVIGRGDCPFGPAQARLGDPIPLFELVLPPRAAKAAIPVLTVVSLMGIVLALVRSAARPPAR
jgi:hypothetical protein